jgi:hypothetical protein
MTWCVHTYTHHVINTNASIIINTHARRTIRAVQRLRCKRLIMALELSIGLDAHAVGGAALLL